MTSSKTDLINSSVAEPDPGSDTFSNPWIRDKFFSGSWIPSGTVSNPYFSELSNYIYLGLEILKYLLVGSKALDLFINKIS